MGVANQLWLVDLEAMRGVWASRDEALLARLDAPQHRYTARLLRVGETGTARSERRGAVVDILSGAACDAQRPHHYHYALEAICHELRTPLAVENDVEPRSLRRLEALLSTERPLDLQRFVPVGERWFLPLPGSADFPFVGWVESARAPAFADELTALRARLPALLEACPESEAARCGDGATLEQLERVYRAAAASGHDVVIFQH